MDARVALLCIRLHNNGQGIGFTDVGFMSVGSEFTGRRFVMMLIITADVDDLRWMWLFLILLHALWRSL